MSAYSEKAPGQRPITRWPDREAGHAGAELHDLARAFHADRLGRAGLLRPCPTMNSPRFRLAARIRTSNCCGPGSGIATSRNSIDGAVVGGGLHEIGLHRTTRIRRQERRRSE